MCTTLQPNGAEGSGRGAPRAHHALKPPFTSADGPAHPQREPNMLIDELIRRGFLVFDRQQPLPLGAAAAPQSWQPESSWKEWVEGGLGGSSTDGGRGGAGSGSAGGGGGSSMGGGSVDSSGDSSGAGWRG
jgi:uncharacterized membrane protein YgcG